MSLADIHQVHPLALQTCLSVFVVFVLCFAQLQPDHTQSSFLDMTCALAAGWPNCQLCGTLNGKIVLWWGVCQVLGGCRCSTKTVSFSTPSWTRRTLKQCCPSQLSIPQGRPYWAAMPQGACTFSLTEMSQPVVAYNRLGKQVRKCFWLG